jgi:hypothetical protein
MTHQDYETINQDAHNLWLEVRALTVAIKSLQLENELLRMQLHNERSLRLAKPEEYQ